jgi:hypothetical protein
MYIFIKLIYNEYIGPYFFYRMLFLKILPVNSSRAMYIYALSGFKFYRLMWVYSFGRGIVVGVFFSLGWGGGFFRLASILQGFDINCEGMGLLWWVSMWMLWIHFSMRSYEVGLLLVGLFSYGCRGWMWELVLCIGSILAIQASGGSIWFVVGWLPMCGCQRVEWGGVDVLINHCDWRSGRLW